MNILLIALYCLIYSANAKLGSRTVYDKDAAEDFAGDTSASKEDGRDASGDRFYTKPIRHPRLSKEHPASAANATTYPRTNKPRVALVKKPIPKFTDAGSEEDYLAKLRFPNRISDTAEHEDEDFSIDDYDFDVNHDEYAGRGKPLEPRVKVKVIRQRLKQTPPKIEKERPAPALGKVKIVMPHEGKPTVKVTRKAVADKLKEEEYDDEFAAGPKSAERYKKSHIKDDGASDENNSREDDRNNRVMRTVRSSPSSLGPHEDQLGGKSSEFMSKTLSYLPLFSLSSMEQPNEEVFAGDPWIGRAMK